jgi:hypothetical protein
MRGAAKSCLCMLRGLNFVVRQLALVVGLAIAAVCLSQGEPPAPSDEVSAIRQQILDLEKEIAEKQATWDKFYAEYQRIMNTSGGRPTQSLRNKINRMDAEARKIKADIDAKTRVLEATREHLASLERDRPAARRRSSGSVDAPGGSLDGGSPADAAKADRSGLPALLSEHLPIIDEWDPVGALGAAQASVRCWTFKDSFGTRERNPDPTTAEVRYIADGRRVLETENDAFGRPPIPSLIPSLTGSNMSNWVAEASRGEMVELRKISVRGFEPQTLDDLEEELEQRTASLVLRFDGDGASRSTRVFDPEGQQIGSIEVEYERVGELHRPLRLQTQDESIYSYRVVIPTLESSSFPAAHRVLEWEYERSGRVASLRFTRAKNTRTTRFSEMVEATRKPEVSRMVNWAKQVLERAVRTMSYEYDDRGRLARVRAVDESPEPDPETTMRLLALEDKISDQRLIDATIAKAAAETARGPQNQPRDGVQCSVTSDGAWVYTRVYELRVRDWDARGRWTKATTFVIDDGGEVEHHEIERAFTDDLPTADPIHGEFQIVPRSKTPSPAVAERNAEAVTPRIAVSASRPPSERAPETAIAPPSEVIAAGPKAEPGLIEDAPEEPKRGANALKSGTRTTDPAADDGSEPQPSDGEGAQWIAILVGTVCVAALAAGVTLLMVRRKP